MPAPLVLTTSNTTPQALQPMTLTWQVNNASSIAPPVCVAFINDHESRRRRRLVLYPDRLLHRQRLLRCRRCHRSAMARNLRIPARLQRSGLSTNTDHRALRLPDSHHRLRGSSNVSVGQTPPSPPMSRSTTTTTPAREAGNQRSRAATTTITHDRQHYLHLQQQRPRNPRI